MEFFGIIEFAIGAYVIYCAISGKGKIYENENLKKDCKEIYHKRIRQACYLLGPLILATGIVDMVNIARDNVFLNYLFYTLFGLTLAMLAILFVITAKYTDRKKAREKKQSASNGALPNAAFDFDADEKNK